MTVFENIAAYKFVSLERLAHWRELISERARELALKGTVLLAPEGINLFVAGPKNAVQDFIEFLRGHQEFADLEIKSSPGDHQPFSRMLVRIKKEIIAFGVDGIDPRRASSPKLGASELKRWLDAGKQVTLLDVRNDYEVELGTFRGALPIGVDNFRDFPQAVDKLPEELKQQPIVMFCTGGIRCEKAGPFMEAQGYGEVYQLDGGILKYFEEVGQQHYEGECFVFDKRVAVDAGLNETSTTQCYNCQHALDEQDQQSALYQPPDCCPYCFRTVEQSAAERARETTERLRRLVDPLPGCTEYDNIRPLNIPGRFDHCTLLESLCEMHPHVSRQAWQGKIDSGCIQYKNQPVTAEFRVRAGMRLDHLQPGTIEPAVAVDLRVIWEDDSILVVDKPAPLPMHPCGRYNRNTLAWILEQAFYPVRPRIVHRLDANTSGLVLLAKKRWVASQLHDQFQAGKVRKRYLAQVAGRFEWDQYECRLPIGRAAGHTGVRQIEAQGLEAFTRFQVVDVDDEFSLLEAVPVTGRTNQIRIHLWSLGRPVVGDPVFLPAGALGDFQTLPVGAPAMRLHAQALEFRHPVSGEQIRLQSEAPGWANPQVVQSQ